MGNVVESVKANKWWVILAIILYILPAAYRLSTGNSIIPILNSTLFLYHDESQITPINLEVLGALFLIPGVLGAVLGVTFLEKLSGRKLVGWEKYVARVFGSLSVALGWTAIQFFGFLFFNPSGPWGDSLWASPDAYARNLLVALIVAPLVPYLIEFKRKMIKKIKLPKLSDFFSKPPPKMKITKSPE